MITCDGRTATPAGTAVIRRDTADIAYVLAGGAEEEGLLLDNLQFNLLTPTCRVELSKEIYSERETITATVFKLANTSSSRVPVLVKAWIVTAGTTPFEVRTLPLSSGCFGLRCTSNLSRHSSPCIHCV
jgi:hypothetical protein